MCGAPQPRGGQKLFQDWLGGSTNDNYFKYSATTHRFTQKDLAKYLRACKELDELEGAKSSDPVPVPGAKNRYEDFVAQHVNQTIAIHGTGDFLSWHRYFVHGYEKALREECGYTG
ncbi:hypothetical protein E8E11_005851 [Didymella keratinophila]|nr:hypothetical protein E8E11_005851 [Didymella keratinophila]